MKSFIKKKPSKSKDLFVHKVYVYTPDKTRSMK